MPPENIMAIRPTGGATAAATGIVLTREMENGVRERGVDLRLNTSATELIVEDGKVIGALVQCKDGTYPIYAKGGVIKGPRAAVNKPFGARRKCRGCTVRKA